MANIAEKTEISKIDTVLHVDKVNQLEKLLKLIQQANYKRKHAAQQYETYSFLSSPFVSRETWAEDVRNLSYVIYRLERYYLKKLCDLNSVAYRQMTPNEQLN